MKERKGRFKGLYLRKLVWWFRFSSGGVQHRINLRTQDEGEAEKLAREILKKGIAEPKVSGKVWKHAIAEYVTAKTKSGNFRVGTASRVKSALKVFSERCGATGPDSVTIFQLQAYYDTRRKSSEAGARSTMAMIQAFLSHAGGLPGRVKLAQGSRPNARQVVVPLATANRWLEECFRPELRFVLFCGFHAGMRAGEIKHSRAAWFDLSRGLIAIPAEEIQTLPNRKKYPWKTKSGEGREIPLSPAFKAFLDSFLEDKKGHCLPSKLDSKDGLWDFRLPFKSFMTRMERSEVFPHAMRHSWISELCNSGNHTIQEVSSWSGDRLETIESNYWKKKAEAGALDLTMSGVRKGKEESEFRKEIREKLARMGEGAMTPNEVSGILFGDGNDNINEQLQERTRSLIED